MPADVLIGEEKSFCDPQHERASRSAADALVSRAVAARQLHAEGSCCVLVAGLRGEVSDVHQDAGKHVGGLRR